MAWTAFVTGASRGLGLEFVKQMLALDPPPDLLFAGCLDRSKADELLVLTQNNECLKVLSMDVTKDADIESAFQQTKRLLGEKGLNLLINNAGIFDRSDGGFLENQTRERMLSHFNVNVTSPLMVSQKFLPLLKRAAALRSGQPMSADKAAIINISSGFGSIYRTKHSVHSEGNAYHYRASKAALNMVTALMSAELLKEDILVVAINPGWVRTEMGGPNATLSVEKSVENCLATMGRLKASSTGLLFDFHGDVIPW